MTGLHRLVGTSNKNPVLQEQTPADKKALALQLVQVVADPLQVAQVESQVVHVLVPSLKYPALQTQMFEERVARVPVHPRHWLNFVPEQVEQLESQGTHDLPLLLTVKPGLHTQELPLTEAFGTQVRQIVESAALHVAQSPEQVRQAPVTVFMKNPVSQSHSLLAATVSLL